MYCLVMAALPHVFSKTTAVLTKRAEPVYCITDLAQIGRVPLQCPLQATSPPLPQRDCGTCPSVYSTKMPFGGCS